MLGYADTRPGLTDPEWHQWLSLRMSLVNSAPGIPRTVGRVKTVREVLTSGESVRAPFIHEDRFPRQTIQGKELVRPSLLYFRTIEIMTPTDDEGNALPPHPGVVMLADYLRMQRARAILDYKSKYVTGYRAPAEYVPLFGHDRFRPFSQEPYFEDRVAFISWPLQTATRWNNYTLER